MESKLLVGGKNIIDHTNEQQKMLEMKRQEIAEQVKQRWILCCFLCFTVLFPYKAPHFIIIFLLHKT